MRELHLHRFLDAYAGLRRLQGRIENKPEVEGIVPHPGHHQYMDFMHEVTAVVIHCRHLNMTGPLRFAEQLMQAVDNRKETYGEIKVRIAELGAVLSAHFEDERVMICDPNRAKYYELDGDPFGKDVFHAFSSAAYDVAEASKCLALDRGTACVMHLMRAVEVTLKALATTVGVPTQVDWGSYIREIDKEIEKRVKASGRRTPDEEFYSQLVVRFDNLKRAWRNPSMHVQDKYTPEEAELAYLAMKSFMQHLAARIRE